MPTTMCIVLYIKCSRGHALRSRLSPIVLLCSLPHLSSGIICPSDNFCVWSTSHRCWSGQGTGRACFMGNGTSAYTVIKLNSILYLPTSNHYFQGTGRWYMVPCSLETSAVWTPVAELQGKPLQLACRKNSWAAANRKWVELAVMRLWRGGDQQQTGAYKAQDEPEALPLVCATGITVLPPAGPKNGPSALLDF